jgi:hypothetical protein
MFQLIDSFFFISLGITFVLLFLMAFHFKNRVSVLEKKNDALTEMCNTIVHEIHVVKQMVTVQVPQPVPLSSTNFNRIPVNTMLYTNQIPKNESEDDSEYESEDGRETVNSEESESSKSIDESEHDDEHLTLEIESIEYSDEITDNGDDDSNLKNIESEETVEVHNIQMSDDNVHILEDSMEDIEVTKIDEVVHVEEDVASEIPSISTNQKPSSYKKMNVQMLRTMVISKGLCSDPSKMKKQELFKMLDDHENE